MTYAYGMKNAPAVGQGLGGLPTREVASSLPRGEVTFAVPGTYVWTPPEGVTSICIVCVGGGGGGTSGTNYGGGGGALSYVNDIPVNSKSLIEITVGEGGSWIPSDTVSGQPGGASSVDVDEVTVCGAYGGSDSAGGSVWVGSGGNGGQGGTTRSTAGGGGAGGYSGDGGDAFSDGSGGGGGGGGVRGDTSVERHGCSGGGGVGFFGEGASGTYSSYRGTGGSGGADSNMPREYSLYYLAEKGGLFGGGGGGFSGFEGGGGGGSGAVRILWGEGRAFPSTDVGPS